MRARLIAVGSELLRGGREDTNGSWIVGRLRRAGVEVVGRAVVGDDEERLAAELVAAMGSAQLVVVTGGLGPTVDDRTRVALARALGRPLERDAEIVRRLRAGFARYGRTYRDEQAVQADRPAGAAWIENPLGTAPGLRVDTAGCRIVALPGVPAEMRAMFDAEVAPWLSTAVGRPTASRVLRVGGRTESSVDAQLRDLYEMPGLEVTILAGSREGIELQLLAWGERSDEAGARLADAERAMTERLGDDLYGRDEETLSMVVGALLTARGETVATAESCTAGMIGAALTDAPGSSGWFRGGLLVYDDRLKVRLAAVDERTLARHGAVSEAVARELARGARERCGTDHGIGVTGIAGPGGGTPDKPVGTVHIAVAGPLDETHRATRMIGDRGLVRRRTTTAAIDLLRRSLVRRAGGGESR